MYRTKGNTIRLDREQALLNKRLRTNTNVTYRLSTFTSLSKNAFYTRLPQ